MIKYTLTNIIVYKKSKNLFILLIMGIKGLFPYLRQKGLIHNIELSQFSCQKCSFDIISYVYKYKSFDPKNWIKLLINLLICLKYNKIITIVVFDGKAPIEKEKEHTKRKEKRTHNEERIKRLKLATETYIETGIVDAELKNFEKDDNLDMDEVIAYTEKLERQNVIITDDDWILIRKILETFNISWVKAEGEAESMCSLLALKGNVNFVLSEDSDNLAYGVPILLSKLTSEGTCEMVIIKEVLSYLNLSRQQFLDYCILCGTDYNDNIRLISNVKSYGLISEYGSLNNMYDDQKYKEKLNTYIPNFKDIQMLFNPIMLKFTQGNVNVHFDYLQSDTIHIINMNKLENIKSILDDNGIEYFNNKIHQLDERTEIILDSLIGME